MESLNSKLNKLHCLVLLGYAKKKNACHSVQLSIVDVSLYKALNYMCSFFLTSEYCCCELCVFVFSYFVLEKSWRQAMCCSHILFSLDCRLSPHFLHILLSPRAEMGYACFSTQLIDGDGVVNVSGLDHFMKEVKLGECGLSYAVVSIMGPQSTGMGFLLSSFF